MKLDVTELPYINSAYLFDKVADQPWAIFLDSGVIDANNTAHSGYDVMAIKPNATLVFDGQVTRYCCGSAAQEVSGDPILVLQSAIPKLDSVDSDKFPYLPGALGYFSYDLVRQYETIPEHAEDDECLPPMATGIYHVVVVIDHAVRKVWLLSLNDNPHTKAVVNEWRALITEVIDELTDEVKKCPDDCANSHHEQEHLLSGALEENMDRSLYQQGFDWVRKYTIAGDCYQVNLAKRFSASVAGNSWLTYQYLRQHSPAPYGAYLNLPFAQVLSNSPESFIQCRDRNVVTRPIKGTQARDHNNPEHDHRIATLLHNSEKDCAENLMIVDLMRNDLSRCCELGSVKVPSLFAVHSFANVHHLISTITGKLKQHLHALDLLRSCFPGGSITGAPKIRAMEIIEELEPHRRGLYCGAIGYLGVDGNLETNIAIRTIVIKDGIARYSAGGGLVIDSNADDEYQEIIDKASMMTDALSKKR